MEGDNFNGDFSTWHPAMGRNLPDLGIQGPREMVDQPKPKTPEQVLQQALELKPTEIRTGPNGENLHDVPGGDLTPGIVQTLPPARLHLTESQVAQGKRWERENGRRGKGPWFVR